MSMTETHAPSRGDRIGLWTFAAAGAGIAVWAVWSAIARILEVLPNRDVGVAGRLLRDAGAGAPRTGRGRRDRGAGARHHHRAVASRRIPRRLSSSSR